MSFIDLLLETGASIFERGSSFVSNNIPQVTSFIDNIPFIGGYLANVNNTEIAVLAGLGLLVFYITKGEFIIKWSKVAFVVVIILVLAGVINL